jgi:hypothetical protein
MHVFDQGPKIFEMLDARFFDVLAFAFLIKSNCTNFELQKFFHSPKTVHLNLKALLYSFLGPSKSIYSFGSKRYKIGFFPTRPEKWGIKMGKSGLTPMIPTLKWA